MVLTKGAHNLLANRVQVTMFSMESEPRLDWLAALGVARSLGSIWDRSPVTPGVYPLFQDLIPVALGTLCHVRSTFRFSTGVEV
jgi:hypothetical protein